ncbi:MAG: M48 family metalloprotease [Acidobacteria bacterium]|nr:M48 family metalloprotease [Acidobacteriota bacterium]
MTGVERIADFALAAYTSLATLALEAAVVGIVLWLVVRTGRGGASSLRYGLIVLALAKFVVPPLPAPWAVNVGVLAPPIERATSPLTLAPETAALDTADEGTVPKDPVDAAAPALFASAAAAETPESSLVEPASLPLRSERPAGDADAVANTVSTTWSLGSALAGLVDNVSLGALLVAMLLVHLTGSLLLLLRRAGHCLAMRRLIAESEPVTDRHVVDLTRTIARRQGIRRRIRVVASGRGVGPAAVGVFRRTIVMPKRLLDTATGAELRAVIAHEVAHHRRGDLLIDWIVFFGGLVWWPHPVYMVLRRDMLRLREDCCDDAAVIEVGGAQNYCQSLLDAATAVGRPRPALPAVAHGSFSHPLGRRIRRLMNPKLKPTPRLSTSGLIMLAAAATLIVPAATTFGTTPQEFPEPIALTETASTTQTEQASPATATSPVFPVASSTATLSAAMTFTSEPTQESERVSYRRNGTIWWGVDDDVITMSPGAIDEFVDKGLDRDFVAGLNGSMNRDVTIDEFAGWTRHGFDADLPGALRAVGVRRLSVMQAMRLVWADADGAYVQSLADSGLESLDIEGVVRLARYEVTGDYIADFRDEGYAALDVDDFVRLRRYEVEAGYAGTYRDAGYELSVDDLVRLHRYEVDEDAVARLSAAGLALKNVDDLVTLSRYEVSDDYIVAMTEGGSVELTTDDLVRLKRYEVTPLLATELRELGQAATTDDLVRLSRYNVSLDYVRGLQQLGYAEPSVDDLVTLQRYEVDLDRIRALADSGYDSLPVSDIVRLQRYAVGADYIRALAGVAGRHFSVDQLVTLKRYEVSADYVHEMLSVGLEGLDVDDLVRLKRYEVTPAFVQRLIDGGFEDLTVDRVIRLKRADG